MEDFEHAIKSAGNSAPGPDGIPYLGYRAVPELAAEVLKGLSDALLNPDVSKTLNLDDFNQAPLVLLPKKATVEDPILGDAYAPKDLRPLSIVGC